MAKGKRQSVQSQVSSGNALVLAKDQQRVKKMLIELATQSQALTKKDIKDWRSAWQMALNVENPSRQRLYDIYTDVDADMHLSGAVEQRKNKVLRKSFKLVDSKGKENPEATEMLETKWFKDLLMYALDSRYWGHSLIELGDIIEVDGKRSYNGVKLIPRKHVIPEYGVITIEPGDEPKKGISYRDGNITDWVIEAGSDNNLGLFLKCAAHTIPKKNMLAFWDQFGEIFGMPIRIGKTTSRDPKEHSKIEALLDGMGAAPWALFPDGTEIEIKETTRGDAFNIYDRRIERANSELSKGVLNQTMTLDSGSSLSQSEVHLNIFEEVVDRDADMIRDIINDQLLPRMIKHGFKLQGLRFCWDETVDYTPEQQVAFETMIAEDRKSVV